MAKIVKNVYVLDCPCCKNIGPEIYPDTATCKAYPDGIPHDVMFSGRRNVSECANGYGYDEKDSIRCLQ
jgi:hypothetical protein